MNSYLNLSFYNPSSCSTVSCVWVSEFRERRGEAVKKWIQEAVSGPKVWLPLSCFVFFFQRDTPVHHKYIYPQTSRCQSARCCRWPSSMSTLKLRGVDTVNNPMRLCVMWLWWQCGLVEARRHLEYGWFVCLCVTETKRPNPFWPHGRRAWQAGERPQRWGYKD